MSIHFEPCVPGEVSLSLFRDGQNRFYLLHSDYSHVDAKLVGLEFVTTSVFRPYEESFHSFLHALKRSSALPKDFPLESDESIFGLLESPFNHASMLPGEREKWSNSIRVQIDNEVNIPLEFRNSYLKITPAFDGSKNFGITIELKENKELSLDLFVNFKDLLKEAYRHIQPQGHSLVSEEQFFVALVQKDIVTPGVAVKVGCFSQNGNVEDQKCTDVRIEVLAASSSVVSVSVKLNTDTYVFDIKNTVGEHSFRRICSEPVFPLTHKAPELLYVRTSPQSAYDFGWDMLMSQDFTSDNISASLFLEKVVKVFETIASLYQHAMKSDISVDSLKKAVEEWGELIHKFGEDNLVLLHELRDQDELRYFKLMLAIQFFGSFTQPVIFTDLNGTLAKIVSGGDWEMFSGVDSAIFDYLNSGMLFVNTGATVENVVSKWLIPSRIVSKSNEGLKGAFPQLVNMKLLCRTGVEMLCFNEETRVLQEYPWVSGIMPHDIISIIGILNDITMTIDYSSFSNFSLEDGSKRGQVSLRVRNGIYTFAYSPVGRLTPESREEFLKDPQNHLLLYDLAAKINHSLSCAGITSISFARSGDITIDGVPCNKAQTYQKVLELLPCNSSPIILDDMFFSSVHQDSMGKEKPGGRLVLEQFYDRGFFLGVSSDSNPLRMFGDYCGDNTLCVRPELVSEYIKAVSDLARIRLAIDGLVPKEFPRL